MKRVYKWCKGTTFPRVGGDYRSDKKGVIFKKLEKVGEPVTVKGRTFQKFTNSNSCVGCVFYNKNNCCDKFHYMDEPCLDNEIWIEIKQNQKDMEENKDVKQTPLEKLVIDFFNNRVSDIEFEKRVSELYAKHSNSENIEKNLKPFDIQKAKQGKPVCTRDGRKARIICFDKNKDIYPLIALVTDKDGYEIITPYKADGVHPTIPNNDLMMLSEKKEGWVNIFRGIKGWAFVGSDIYDTIQQAKEYASNSFSDLIDTIKIEWEE